MIAFRFLAGLGGSAPLAIGGGVLSDLFRAEERGRAISIYSLAPLLGPAIGPIAGGFISEKTTWRWVFWATTIADAVIQVTGLFFLQETYTPVLLHRKKLKLIKETGNENLHTEYDHPDRTVLRTLEDQSQPPLQAPRHPNHYTSPTPLSWPTSTASCTSSSPPSPPSGKPSITRCIGTGGLNYISSRLRLLHRNPSLRPSCKTASIPRSKRATAESESPSFASRL